MTFHVNPLNSGIHSVDTYEFSKLDDGARTYYPVTELLAVGTWYEQNSGYPITFHDDGTYEDVEYATSPGFWEMRDSFIYAYLESDSSAPFISYQFTDDTYTALTDGTYTYHNQQPAPKQSQSSQASEVPQGSSSSAAAA